MCCVYVLCVCVVCVCCVYVLCVCVVCMCCVCVSLRLCAQRAHKVCELMCLFIYAYIYIQTHICLGGLRLHVKVPQLMHLFIYMHINVYTYTFNLGSLYMCHVRYICVTIYVSRTHKYVYIYI